MREADPTCKDRTLRVPENRLTVLHSRSRARTVDAMAGGLLRFASIFTAVFAFGFALGRSSGMDAATA